MNPDLAMGDELLKKTGAGNLFMVFGEPDIELRTAARTASCRSRSTASTSTTPRPARSAATPPTTSPAGSSTPTTTSESFFVRHAYFTGADDPYEKLKRALRAEIDEAAWATLYSHRQPPVRPAATGKIAVKVINHYGDEVLKVYETPTGAEDEGAVAILNSPDRPAG